MSLLVLTEEEEYGVLLTASSTSSDLTSATVLGVSILTMTSRTGDHTTATSTAAGGEGATFVSVVQ